MYPGRKLRAEAGLNPHERSLLNATDLPVIACAQQSHQARMQWRGIGEAPGWSACGWYQRPRMNRQLFHDLLRHLSDCICGLMDAGFIAS
jgi:hypothetical protein